MSMIFSAARRPVLAGIVRSGVTSYDNGKLPLRQRGFGTAHYDLKLCKCMQISRCYMLKCNYKTYSWIQEFAMSLWSIELILLAVMYFHQSLAQVKSWFCTFGTYNMLSFLVIKFMRGLLPSPVCYALMYERTWVVGGHICPTDVKDDRTKKSSEI